MKLAESGQMYLETILVLSKSSAKVRSIDIVEYMGFSKPSVSRAVKHLKGGGYITVDCDGYITLTALGQSEADKMYERHRILSAFLEEIGVDAETAASDACKIEHVISDKSFDMIKKRIKLSTEK
ncbi:MAG: metal-dependent transcriptional regulator [Clostridia bacterium]|nr:metal-dependent transcriptional regulator [Clostridia bacterium]